MKESRFLHKQRKPRLFVGSKTLSDESIDIPKYMKMIEYALNCVRSTKADEKSSISANLMGFHIFLQFLS